MIAYTSYLTDGRVRLEAESLVQWGYEVFFLALKSSNQPHTFSVSGVNVVELNVQKYQGKSKLRYLASYLLFFLYAFWTCSLLFFRSRVRIIHVHNMPDILVFSGLIPRIFGCKLILDIHDTMPETYAGKFETNSQRLFKLLTLEEKVSCAIAHRVLAVNHVQRDVILGRGVPSEKVATVVTMPSFAECGSQPVTEDYGFRLVNHGTVSKRLGTDILIRAAPRLSQEIEGFELHIIGSGDDWQEIVELSESLNLQNCVHFHRAVPWDALPQKLVTMHAGIVCNRANRATELMLPSKLIDYVTLGIPAVVPRLKAIEYYFSPEMVTYFAAENVESIVSSVLVLYRDSNRRRTQAAEARRFLATYDWRKNQQLKRLYADLFEKEPAERDAAARQNVVMDDPVE